MSATPTGKRIKMTDLKSTFALFSFIRPYKKTFIAGCFFLLLSSTTSLIFPYVAGKLIDAATGKATGFFSNINTIAVGLVLVLVLQSVFSYLRVWWFAIVTEKSMADIRNQLYSNIIEMPLHFFETRRVGELISRITSDVAQLQETLSITLAEFFRQTATLIVGIIIILITSTQLTLLMLATYPPIIIAAIFFGRYIRKLSKKTQDALAESNIVVNETLQAIHVVKAFTNESYEQNRFSHSMNDVVKYALQAAKYRGAFISFIIFGLFGGIVLVLWYGAVLVSNQQMTIGDLTAFIIYTAFIGGSVGGMGEIYSKIQKTVGASERILDILAEQSAEKYKADNLPESVDKNGKISFRNVKFHYPSRPDVEVLKSISFEVEKGQKIALVGVSGAGKSTIAQLMLRFYDIQSGEILIDNKNILDIQHLTLRKMIGIVPQEVVLFGGTIKENIQYGNINASDEQINQAAQQANAFDFINNFPEKMETKVGERGIKLSGGQKQRIAIARALLKNPAILILDEATSSLDAESELLVQNALENLMQNRTTIIIAHRLSTVRKADKILVLENGGIKEFGNHNQLMLNDNGLYKHLVNLQLQQ